MSFLYNALMISIASYDPDLSASLNRELARQREGLEMIPSENFVSEAVLEALGCVATNKYAEGYIGKRYYGGCQFIDEMEGLAIERAKKLFGAEHVNVQPLSGAPATGRSSKIMTSARRAAGRWTDSSSRTLPYSSITASTVRIIVSLLSVLSVHEAGYSCLTP